MRLRPHLLRSASRPIRAAPSATEKLDEIFDPWDFLTRIDTVFDRLEQLTSSRVAQFDRLRMHFNHWRLARLGRGAFSVAAAAPVIK